MHSHTPELLSSFYTTHQHWWTISISFGTTTWNIEIVLCGIKCSQKVLCILTKKEIITGSCPVASSDYSNPTWWLSTLSKAGGEHIWAWSITYLKLLPQPLPSHWDSKDGKSSKRSQGYNELEGRIGSSYLYLSYIILYTIIRTANWVGGGNHGPNWMSKILLEQSTWAKNPRLLAALKDFERQFLFQNLLQ